MYAILFGENFTNGCLKAYSNTKKEAEKYLRKSGYFLNKRQGLFLNSRYDDGHWAKIVKVDHITDVHFPMPEEIK